MNEVRIVVILILLVFALIGHRKGITGEIASLVSVALSILGIALIVRVVIYLDITGAKVNSECVVCQGNFTPFFLYCLFKI